jgi:1-phosphofructokinase
MYDRRSGTRTLIARSESSPIDRHTVDKLYSLTLAHAIERDCCVLAGNIDTGIVPPSFYGRLCADLTTIGVPIIADAHGPELDEMLEQHSIHLVKVSDQDLRDDGVLDDDTDQGLTAAVTDLADRVPNDLAVTRGPDRPAVARMAGSWYSVSPPRLAAVDLRGAGDAMAGAMAVAYSRGLRGVEVLRYGAAAGAASVTRRGLASVDAELVDALLPRVRVDPADGIGDAVAAR